MGSLSRGTVVCTVVVVVAVCMYVRCYCKRGREGATTGGAYVRPPRLRPGEILEQHWAPFAVLAGARLSCSTAPLDAANTRLLVDARAAEATQSVKGDGPARPGRGPKEACDTGGSWTGSISDGMPTAGGPGSCGPAESGTIRYRARGRAWGCCTVGVEMRSTRARRDVQLISRREREAAAGCWLLAAWP